MSLRIIHAATGVPAVSAADRGFAYGDGLFETLRLHAGAPVRWDAHWARLRRGAEALAIPLAAEDEGKARMAAQAACGGVQRAVLKLVLTRGEGGRGYAPPPDARPTLVIGIHDLPARAPADLAVRWCRTRLAIQPRLAGIKHLNRLEQVLARAEWTTSSIDEGLMLDSADEVVGATSANVFALVFGLWITPPVDMRGVAGIMRGWVLANASAREAPLTRTMLEAADAVFLCNAVRGILPVGSLGDRRWSMHPALDAIRRRLHKAEPAFDPGR